MTAMTSPGPTGSPADTRTSVTVPAFSAFTLFSIFMASRTQMVWPTSTVSPTVTSTLTTVPCMGTDTVPDPAAPEDAPLALRPPEDRAVPEAGTASPVSGTQSVTW